MNKLISFLAFISVCFSSCNDTSSTTATTSNVESDAAKNKANSNEVYKAMETGDVSKMDSILDKDVIDHEGNLQGIDTLKKMIANMHNSIKDLKVETLANATDGDYNFAYIRTTGTTVDASMGMPAGTKLDMKSVDVVKMKNGMAVEHWGFSDRNEMMEMGKGMPPGMDHKMDGKMGNKKDTMMKK
ncbi:MAG: ester cyclase [Ginsengibacter sp.]